MARDEAYQAAEKKIAEALESGATVLNLSSYAIDRFELTEIPETIIQLKQLRVLYLNNNQLSSLPNWIGQLYQLEELDISNNLLTALPVSLGQLSQLMDLNAYGNQLTTLPENLKNLKNLVKLRIHDNNFQLIPDFIKELNNLREFYFYGNNLKELPEWLKKCTNLETLDLTDQKLNNIPEWVLGFKNLKVLYLDKNSIVTIPDWISKLEDLEYIYLDNNQITSIPSSLNSLKQLEQITLSDNPLTPELEEAYAQGIDAIKLFLRAGAVTPSYEAKIILVGEGEVGKTCLMDALLDKPWQEHPSTHGIEIKTLKTIDSKSQKEITLNGWDFGGQRVYRPTHQLFFSAPAVYLVVWKPREGPQQGFVKEWIQLVKRREPSAKIIVVATHGGPQQRQPDIDRQELWDLFGKDTVVDFFWVDSKPDENGKRKGIEELKEAIARVAAELPEVGRSVPKSFADVRAALAEKGAPYLPLDEVLAICHAHDMDDEIARLFITISHRLGHLTHYENDPALRDIVILRPDWLASAMSYVLDDEATRTAHGLVKFSRLSQLWNDPERPAETRYNDSLHRIFLRLMERFDLSYRVAGLSKDDDSDPVSLIAQLVPDTTPTEDVFTNAWNLTPAQGDIQQTQICCIVDAQSGQTANAEGLFYQLIVRLHKFSLGRANYNNSVHWQRGLIVDGDYNGRALLRHIGNDVHITVRAPYPERFLAMLTEEVKYLVESFWEGLRCDVTVPCLNPNPCAGLFEVEKLIENKKRGRPEVPCIICNEWQNIDQLLLNAPSARPVAVGETLASQAVLSELSQLRKVLVKQNDAVMGRFDTLDASQKELLSKADASFNGLMKAFTDEAKEGPRLFSMRPVDPKWLEKPKQLIRQKFRILLWCEHSQLPLFVLNQEGDNHGIYEIDLPYEWVTKAAPYIKAVTATLSLILPVASSYTKMVMPDDQYKNIEKELAFGKDVFDSFLKGSDKVTDWADKADAPDLPHGAMQRAEGALLRELHSFLKEKDPGFGGLKRVMNKRQEFLWVHEKFASEY